MKKYKLPLLLAALLVCLSLAGCKELPMDYAAVTAETQTVIVGETLTLNVPLPIEKAQGIAIAVTDATHQPISVDYTAPDLVITGIAEGEAEVQIEFSAGLFYKKSHITIPVMVLLPQLEAEITDKNSGTAYAFATPDGIFTCSMGSDSTFEVTSAEADITFTAKLAAPETAEILTDGLGMTLKPIKPGKTTLVLTASKEGFRDATMTCTVEVVAIPTPLALSEGAEESIKAEKGKATTVPLETSGELSVSTSDSAVATAAVSDGKLTVTGVAEGTATVTVTAKAENYLDNALVLTCTVTAAAPPPAPAAASGPYADLVNEIVKYTNVERANEGLAPLKLSSALSKAAAVRAKETATPGYQEHTRPDGRRGLTAITDAGLGEYNAVGENLSGADFAEDGEAIVQRWMDSPPHRAAILMPEFKTIGVGVYYDNDMYRYCQLFTGTKF